MTANTLDAHVAAVRKEIGRQARTAPEKPQGFTVIKLLSAALVLMVAAAWAIHRPTAIDTASDVRVILQQARHEVLDYYHRTGTMPDEILNPALRPYVEYARLSTDDFGLTARIGDVERRH